MGIPALSFAAQKMKKATSFSPKKVLVIGAGMSGAAAAWQLQQRGFEVQVIEGRDRIGGRVFSTKIADTPIDLGASWIHFHKGNPLTTLAKQLQLPTHPTDYENIHLYDNNGNSIPKIALLSAYNQIKKATRKAEKAIRSLEQDISVAELLHRFLPTNKPHQTQYLHFIKNSMESDWGADFTDVSAKYYFEAESLIGAQDLFVVGCYGKIIEHLLQGINVQLNQKVKTISQQNNRIYVTTENTNFDADAVVVTIPLGVLQTNEVTFTPSLPNAKQQAINRLKMGLLDKTILEFESCFWDKNSEFLGILAAPSSTQHDYIVNYQPFAQKPILMAFTSRQYAMHLETQDDETLRRYWQNLLYKPFRQQNLDIKNIIATRWWNDGFARGSYSYIPTGAAPADISALAAPVGNIYFAGEATEPTHYSYLHGAYLSGIRAGNEVVS